MVVTEELTENEWEIARAIAKTLVQADTDANELGKAIAYLRNYANQDGTKLFDYLKTLVRNGRQIGHSKRTSDYYQSIDNACNQYLKAYQDNPPVMLHILGWSYRLMRYYKNAEPVVESARQAEIAEVVSTHDFKVGQILDATVTAIKGNKVTYTILETIKLTEKEPKKAKLLSEGQNVKVEIVDLKEDGSLKKVKCNL
ncbi:hypothetical protein [Coleofasciculus sp. E1-EBD-02]|uniref:hypothetical protein n=1 Tax=Coleofasciculus sp. E1-EBD-02 TaxID=3068481 RepID=UPI0033051A70